MLRLVRSLKNSFAPINQIPPEVLLLIPGYFNEDDDGDGDNDNNTDQGLITLTHVCHGWRDVFTSCSSLWTRLDFTNVEKTRTYIQRSRSSPLEICLEKGQDTSFLDDAFSLVIPYLRQLKSLTICAGDLPDALRHFRCQAPLLEELSIFLYKDHNQILDGALFGGDLSSLRKLTLSGAITITHFPWNNMANLKVLNLISWGPGYSMTRLLNFFESAPLLHMVRLKDSIPDSSDVLPQRIIPLPHLKSFITADTPHSILLNHLCIPTGASLILTSNFFSGEESPLLDCLPEASSNLKNLSHITMVNLGFDPEKKFVRLSGPSGSLRVLACWVQREADSYTMDCRILHSLAPPILSTTRRLAISGYSHPEEPLVFQTLLSTKNLRTLVLTKCNNLPFILALDLSGLLSLILTVDILEG